MTSLAVAVALFAAGVGHRSDAAAARRSFRDAARAFAAAWADGGCPPAVAVAAARSHLLAGSPPLAVAALLAGLREYPADADLRAELLAVRETIRYPEPADPAARVRPDPPGGLRHRVSGWDVFLAAAGCGVLAVVGLGRALTTRPPWAMPVAIGGLLGLAAASAVAWVIETEPPPAVVVAADGTVLRTGNGVTFPPRTPEPLPAGAELVELGRRGGWVQVELPGGAAGWLPEAAVIPEGVRP